MKKLLLILLLLISATSYGQWKRIVVTDSASINGAWFKGLNAPNTWNADQNFNIVIADSIRGSIFRTLDGSAIIDFDTTKLTWTGSKLGIKANSITHAEIAPNTITVNEIAPSVIDSLAIRVDTAYYRALIDSLLSDIDTSYISGRIDDLEDSIATHNNEINSLKDTTNYHGTRINTNEAEINTTNDSISSHNSRINVLKDTTTSHNSRINTNRGSITTIDDSIGVHNARINANRKSIVDTASSHNSRINLLVDTAGIHRSNINAFTDSVNIHRGKINSFTDSISTHRGDINVGKDSISAHNSRINTDRQLSVDSIGSHNTRINTDRQLATDSISIHNTRINSAVKYSVDSISSHNSRLNVSTDSVTAHNTRINTTTKYATDSITAHNTRINTLKNEVDTKIPINDSLEIGTVLLRDNGSSLAIDNDVTVKGNLSADTVTVDAVVNNGLAYGSVYISDDYPDTIVVASTDQYYTVGAVVDGRGKNWTSGGVLKNVRVLDSSIVVQVAGKYEVSYSFSFQTITGAVNAYYNFYLFVNDVKQEKTGAKRLMSGVNDLGVGAVAPTVLDLADNDEIKFKLRSPSDNSNNVCFQYAIIHVKKIDN